MTSDPERTLREALTAHARRLVPDERPAPEPDFAREPRRKPHVRWLAPVAAAASVLGIVTGVVLVGSAGSGPDRAANSPRPASSLTVTRTHPTVHVKLLNDDGAQYGVGMPVIAYFSQNITDGRPLQRATKVTVNGAPQQGAWYFERSAAGKGPIEAHLRLAKYWPAYAKVVVDLPIKGLSAGGGLTYDDNLTTRFTTGAANTAIVDGRTHELTLQHDGTRIGPFRVALGPNTRPGKKVVMEKPGTVTMTIDGRVRPVQYAQRLTYGGEYLVAAPWNTTAITDGHDTSNGSTDLTTADAKTLFGLLRIGDVVDYEGTHGVPMAVGSGYGDWTVPWSTWLTGGLVRTR